MDVWAVWWWSEEDTSVIGCSQSRKPDMAGVAKAAVEKLPPSHLLVVVLVVAVAAALVAGRKLGLW